MDTLSVATGAWYETKEVIAAFVGATLAFALIVLYDWLKSRRRRRAHFAALRAEIEHCRTLAQTYLTDGIPAPLYRLPTIAYAHSLPALLADGGLNEAHTRDLLAFFNHVETFNRGLDQSEAARRILDSAERDAKLSEEFSRNHLKAEKLIPLRSQSNSLYDAAASVVNSRLRCYRL
ncbi:hypothetical protein GPA22_03825 [Aromatoleum toluvorans]|uniref:Uncharacterized protein n=1 Tax=Aromatoleum toluvorans TaxID=92002 RepID=A0ABX1PUI8_9RHOO|nr:hypothetical protein [Aromatoleum toluvorans]NMG42865.1 hypothetical protein [Aromatoleum toluvorans]